MANVLVISPHLDDAALSYGATLAQLAKDGDQILVYTVFAGTPEPPYSPAAERYHATWNLHEDPVRTRRDEDLAAMGTLGVTALHGQFLDAIYRRDDDGKWLIGKGAKASNVQSDESILEESIDRTLRELITEHRPNLILTCAALGTHIDHVRARDTTVSAAAETGIPVRLWEDLPYGLWAKERPPLPDQQECGQPILTAPDQNAWTAKTNAVSSYASQLTMLQYQDTPILEQLNRHSRTFTPDSRHELAWPLERGHQPWRTSERPSR